MKYLNLIGIFVMAIVITSCSDQKVKKEQVEVHLDEVGTNFGGELFNVKIKNHRIGP